MTKSESALESKESHVILSVDSLKVRYSNGALGVIDVSLEVDEGEVVALFGPNGAGKTTTVRGVSGFLRSERARVVDGSVKLFGRDSTNAEPHRTAAMGVAFVPERRKIFASLSVADNLEVLGKRPSRARRAEIYERIYEIFPPLAERRRELAGRLSGGQQQMLAIARSLMCEAKLLIIDEVTLGLHHSIHGPLFAVIKQIAEAGTAVLVVDESTGRALDVVDRCYLLNGGHVRMSGSAADFAGNEMLAAGYVELN
jgi:branched-chain amino acid transport system ATP-binding protein